MYFIWYHRIDLGFDWNEICRRFNSQFPSRRRRGFQGIRCKFYRFLKEKSGHSLREQQKMRDEQPLRKGVSFSVDSEAPTYSVRESTNVRYPWMREDHVKAL